MEQKRFEQEQALLQEQINYQRRQIELHRQAEYEQLQKDRAELQHAHRERANSVYTANTTGSNDHSNHAPPRVSFVQLSSPSGSHSNHNSPAQRRHKRHVSISEGNKNRRGSVGIAANRRNSYAGSHVNKHTDSSLASHDKSHVEESESTVAMDQMAELSSLLQLQQQLNQRHEEELMKQKQQAPPELPKHKKSANRNGNTKKNTDGTTLPVDNHDASIQNGNDTIVTGNVPDVSDILDAPEIQDVDNKNTSPVEAYELPVPLDLLTIHATATVPTHNTNSVHDSVTSLGFSPMSPPLFVHFQDLSTMEPEAGHYNETDYDVKDNGVADGTYENASMYAQYFQEAPMYGLETAEDRTKADTYDTQDESQQYPSGPPFTILESIQSAQPSMDVYDGDVNSAVEPENPVGQSLAEDKLPREDGKPTTAEKSQPEVGPSASSNTPPVIDTTNEETELYTDTGSSGGGVNSPFPEPAATASEKMWLNVSMYTDDYNISGMNSVDITELPLEVEHTPVYIHDLHTSVSVNNSDYNTADNSGNANVTENRPLSPFADLYIPVIPPSPHAHSHPARAHAKAMEQSEDEEPRLEEDL